MLRQLTILVACFTLASGTNQLQGSSELQKSKKFPQVSQASFNNAYDYVLEKKVTEWTLKKTLDLVNYYFTHFLNVLEEVELANFDIREFSFQRIIAKLEYPEDTFKTFEQICKDYGFTPETHEVTTDDGYILVLHRVYKDYNFVQSTKSSTGTVKKPVILFNHGIQDSSDAWIINGPERSPIFFAANYGYDVWAINTRGNKYSKKHVRLDSSVDEEFWDYSFPDAGKYDLPATINYIKWKTKMSENEKLSIVAHSQGNTELLYGMIKDPDYYKKNINSYIALSPISRITKVAPNIMNGVLFFVHFGGILEMLQVYDPTYYIQKFLVYFCGFQIDICKIGVGFFVTDKVKPIDSQQLRVFFGHYPGATSYKSWVHWAQIYLSQRFQEYDYGETMNQRIYGSLRPPMLSLEPVQQTGIPIVMFVGNDDTLVTPQDSEWLKNQLGSCVKDMIYLNGGHLQYFIRQDVSYLETAMDYIAKYRVTDSNI